MRKVKIVVPGTSANLGVGFDSLGIAFNLFNSYIFEESAQDELAGFEGIYQENNLVLKSFKTFLKENNEEEIKVKITQVDKNIPKERGLGGSSACIVAGCKAANYFLGNKYDTDTIINVSTKIEGHPDNVLPCVLGGLTSGFISNGKVYYSKYKVSKKLHFKVLVPDFSLKTSVARSSLPKEIDFREAIDNLSKAVTLPKLFEKGNLSEIKAATVGAIHEKYRYPLIEKGLLIKEKIEDINHVVLISGAGPTLLVISDINDEIPKFDGWNEIEVKIKNK